VQPLGAPQQQPSALSATEVIPPQSQVYLQPLASSQPSSVPNAPVSPITPTEHQPTTPGNVSYSSSSAPNSAISPITPTEYTPTPKPKGRPKGSKNTPKSSETKQPENKKPKR
jgi:hypothetical protein